ncbi:MAG TPA: hypothetical protein DEG06_02400 [Lachnospiraceae bacterium]|jgi:hypothetical protein|nr:hypothetical protein [Lachnospiraceae bacterium]HCA70703.1 hypothetical protein [Lachnospiraceae bacterium]HCM13937.1 hypothetical protein [Lachnospiraceae bacterium]HCR40435.1 hypothetical protein [Lachnospiraceae bacterium]
MKKKLGKTYRIVAFFIGVFGGVGSLVIAYLRASSIIASPDLGNINTIYFFRYLLLYWFCIFIVSAFFYAIGYIIELLQSLNKNISDISSTKDDMSEFAPRV